MKEDAIELPYKTLPFGKQEVPRTQHMTIPWNPKKEKAYNKGKFLKKTFVKCWSHSNGLFVGIQTSTN